MDKETLDAILDTRGIELKHTLETRQIAFDRDRLLQQAIFELLHILIKNDVIDVEEAKAVYEALSMRKEGENDD